LKEEFTLTVLSYQWVAANLMIELKVLPLSLLIMYSAVEENLIDRIERLNWSKYFINISFISLNLIDRIER